VLKPQVPPPSLLAKLRTLGRFALLREIARGGMGIVFEAIDKSNGERVAVKVLRHGLQANAVARQRLLREVEAASRVDHPTIIKIRGWGEEAGVTYFAMEYVSGKPLSKFLSPIAPFALHTTVRIIEQIAAGLACVHRAGLVHRDIKPDNIILLKDMATRLSDFGVAKLPNSSLTLAGELWGTPHYMSPEQLHGQLEIDGRSDIFSLGVVLFEMLTCRKPFGGAVTRMSLIRQIIENPVPRVTQLTPEIPQPFDAVVGRALAKLPGDRYQTCEEFSRDLAAAMASCRLANRRHEAPGRSQ
jgi:serine/threonine-protein kinase